MITDAIATRINYAITTDPADPADVAALVDEVAALVEPLDELGWTRHAERLEHLNADLARGLDATPRTVALKAMIDGLLDTHATILGGAPPYPAEEWPGGAFAF
jgi:hypothetical protein